MNCLLEISATMTITKEKFRVSRSTCRPLGLFTNRHGLCDPISLVGQRFLSSLRTVPRLRDNVSPLPWDFIWRRNYNILRYPCEILIRGSHLLFFNEFSMKSIVSPLDNNFLSLSKHEPIVTKKYEQIIDIEVQM